MIDSMHVLDVLQKRGYVPQDDASEGEGWFDRSFGRFTVRAVLSNEDNDSEIILFTDRNYVIVWSAEFRGAPGAVFLATLDAAEKEAGQR
jgi:hypothetical protein